MQQLKAGIRRYVWFLFVLWCVLAVGIWQQSKQTVQLLSTVNELGRKVEEVRNFFNFELPYRVQHVDPVSLRLQLVYAVRLQLESEYLEGILPPDLTQLLYSTDRFLENAHAFIGSDKELVSLAEQLRNNRDRDNNSEKVHSMYYRLGALVLESIFSDSATNADTYRELDSLFIASDSLVVEERTAFQRRLAQTSSVLAANAQGSYLAEQLLKPDLANQFATTNMALEQSLAKLIELLGGVSGLFLVMVTWAAFDKRDPINSAGNETSEVSSNSLKAEINPNTGLLKKNDVQTTPPSSSSEEMPVVTDEPYIDINKMLESLSGDEEAVRMLLEVFIQDHSNDGTKLCQLFHSDQEQAQRVVHSLKGVSGSLGAMPLNSISGDIELLIKEKQNVPDNKLARLNDILDQTILFATNVLKSEKIQKTLKY
ncbi:MAG: Hpt domain-containing protein [Vibrionaceae bacterium]|nr:Hpt domain-containing protein [Vibrionaceae bacterium]